MSHQHTKNICPLCEAVRNCRCMSPNKVTTYDPCESCASNAVNEDAVACSTGAANVATFNGSLFGGKGRRPTAGTKKGIPVIRYKNTMVIKPKRKLSEASRHSFTAFLTETVTDSEENFDSSDVISKLAKNAEMSDKLDGDELAVFGLEDADGQITKVYVPAEEGKEFEKALGDAMRHTTENGQTEIAAMLFDMKDKFKIVDVKWPEVQEDEEAAPTDPAAIGADPAAGAPPADPNAPPADPNAPPADPNAPPAPGDDMPMDGGPAAPGADMAPPADASGGTNDLIVQILDMLKADADARKADAAAKTAEANAKESEAAAKIAAAKIQGEESVMDAEAYFKARKEEKKEADRLKMLAKYRQETQMDTPDQPQGEVKPVGQEMDMPKSAPGAGPGADEEEERVGGIRRHLLNLLNGMR